MTDYEVVYVDDDDEWDDVWDEEEPASYPFARSQHGGYASYWMDRFGGIEWQVEDDASKYKEALKAVSRAANLVSNRNISAGCGDERQIVIRWSDGSPNHCNSIEHNIVYLSPDPVSSANRREGYSDDRVIDVLIGSALTESAYKGTATYDAETRIVNNMGPEWDPCKGNIDVARVAEKLWRELCQKMWFTSECIAAQESVMLDYPGFSPYFKEMREYYTDSEAKKKLEDALGESVEDPTVQNAVQATIWNLIHRDDPVKLPTVYHKPVTLAVESLLRMRSSDGRARTTLQIQRRFDKAFRLELDPDKNPGEGGEHQGAPSLSKLGMHVNHLGIADNHTGLEHLSEMDPTEDESDEGDESHVIGVPNGDKYEEEVFNIDPNPQPAAYKAQVRALQGLITGLKNRLKLRNEQAAMYERGMQRGSLDEGSLYKLGFYPLGMSDNHIFERQTVLDKPDIAFMLLVDESGSMSNTATNGERKDSIARKAAIVIAEALQSIEGVHLSVMGHTAEQVGKNGLVLYHHLTPQNGDLSSLVNIKARNNNADGYAIQVAAKRMLEWYPNAPTKVLIHVSDGLPMARSYGGALAQDHVRRVCEYYARRGIRTVAVGIDSSALTSEAMATMYGENNWALLKDADLLPLVASNLISKTVQRESRF